MKITSAQRIAIFFIGKPPSPIKPLSRYHLSTLEIQSNVQHIRWFSTKVNAYVKEMFIQTFAKKRSMRNIHHLSMLLMTSLCMQTLYSSLEDLEIALHKDLAMIGYDSLAEPLDDSSPTTVLDVAIVGGGMAGLSSSFGLLRQNITKICVYDQNDEGYEGPWRTSARMKVLSSDKNAIGPALFVPSLTFHAWYIAQFGQKAWESIDYIPTWLWANYLIWFKSVLQLPVKNSHHLQDITPQENGVIKLIFKKLDGALKEVLTRKVIIATGRGGFGGAELPEFIKDLPRSRYAHTSDTIAPTSVHGKDVAIIGIGASAFDAAALALEHGAHSVTILMRRATPPLISKSWYFATPSAMQGFYSLDDEHRWNLFKEIFECGSTVPAYSLERIKGFTNVKMYPHTSINSIKEGENNNIEIITPGCTLQCDFLIVATGYAVNGKNQPELATIIDDVLLWGDIVDHHDSSVDTKLSAFPYLGRHLEFKEKVPGKAPYLKNIHCFNHAASLSHGFITNDIAGISFGALRLTEGIAADLFSLDGVKHLSNIQDFSHSDLQPEAFEWLLSNTDHCGKIKRLVRSLTRSGAT